MTVYNTVSTGTGATAVTSGEYYNDGTGTVTAWSLFFSKLLTGLTIGTNYTLIVQGFADGITGIEDATIDASSIPDQCHLTLTVIH